MRGFARRFRQPLLATALTLLLGACANPASPYPWLVDGVGGTVPNWDPAYGSYAFLVDLSSDPSDPGNTAIQRGTIGASGQLDIPLLEVASDDLGTLSFGCPGLEVEVEGVLATRLLFSTLPNPGGADVAAAAIYASSSDAPTSTTPGTTIVSWIYLAEDLKEPVLHECPNESFELELKAGWNTAIATVEDDGSVSLATGVPPAGLSFFLDTEPAALAPQTLEREALDRGARSRLIRVRRTLPEEGPLCWHWSSPPPASSVS